MVKYAIIVAGGNGSRMQSSIPKQFLLLKGKPILMHTIQAFTDYSKDIQIILVLPEEVKPSWDQLCTEYGFNTKVQVISGGKSRYHSVKNGLDTIVNNEPGLVAIHDGVRPLINARILNESYETASKHGSAIAATALKDSIRLVQPGKTKALDRMAYRLIQTPQTFEIQLIKKAFNTVSYHSGLTDDAAVAEEFGHTVHLFEGSYDNIKITTSEDLIFAEAILANKKGGNL